MNAVKEFAGKDESKPVIYPKAEALIIRMEHERHYRVALMCNVLLNSLRAKNCRLIVQARRSGEDDPLCKRRACPTTDARDVAVMEFVSKLREILGNEIVADDPETLAAHSGDKWFASHPPEVVVFARSTAM